MCAHSQACGATIAAEGLPIAIKETVAAASIGARWSCVEERRA